MKILWKELCIKSDKNAKFWTFIKGSYLYFALYKNIVFFVKDFRFSKVNISNILIQNGLSS